MKKVIRQLHHSGSIVDKERYYLKLRFKEGRLHSDEIVPLLPNLPKGAPHFKEWKSRKHALNILLNYMNEKQKNLNVLDMGCGNGWMTNKIAMQGYQVTGLDVNLEELNQARRLFQSDNINFIYADIFQEPSIGKFDLIILASSVQYFPSLTDTINTLFKYLSPGGEIIIMESHLYPKFTINDAKKRSKDYFDQMEASEMEKYYFHHSVEALDCYNFNYIYKNSQSIFNKIFTPYQSIFPIITIKGN
mgnify:CR=1 FL=1